MCGKNAFTTDHGETDQGDSTVQPTTPGLRFFTQGTAGHLRELIVAMKRHHTDTVRFATVEYNDDDLEVFELRRIERSIEEVAGEMHKQAHAPQVGAHAARPEDAVAFSADLAGNGEGQNGSVSAAETAFGAYMEELEEVLQYVRDVAAHQQERSYLIRRGKELEAKLADGSLPSIVRDLFAH